MANHHFIELQVFVEKKAVPMLVNAAAVYSFRRLDQGADSTRGDIPDGAKVTLFNYSGKREFLANSYDEVADLLGAKRDEGL